MILKKLNLENFLPYKDKHEVEFAVDEKKNVTIIHAPNTFGKTSLLRAIKWVLYGRVLHKNNKEFNLIDILNTEAADESNYFCKVGLEFEEKGTEYKIVRQFDAKKQFPQNDEDFEKDVNLWVDNILQSGAQIEHIINQIAPEPVSRFFLFDGELLQEYQELLDSDSDIGKKIKESIEQILGVPAIINGKIDAKVLLDQARKNQNKDVKKQNELADLVNAIEGLQSANEVISNDIKTLQVQTNEIKQKIEEIDNQTQDLDKKHEFVKKIDEIKALLKTYYDRQKQLEESKLDLASNSWKLLLKKKYTAGINDQDTDKNQNDILEEIGGLKVEIKILDSTIKNSRCDVCKSNDININSITELMNKKISQLNNLQSSVIDSKPSLDLISKLFDVGDRSIMDVYKELKNLTVSITEQENKLEDMREANSSEEDRDLIKQNVEKKGRYTQQIVEINSQITGHENQINKNNMQINSIQARINQTTGGSKSSFTKYVEFYENLYKIFDESINNLRDKLKEEVQENATKAFKELAHRKNYESLQINNHYGLTILDNANKPVPARSSGAEQIVALSLIDGLSKTGQKSRPVVMDTPFGRLDKEHRENILKYMPTSASQLILFAHGGEVDDAMLSSIRSMIGKEYEIKLSSNQKSSYLGVKNG